jgi:hypothetical protein
MHLVCIRQFGDFLPGDDYPEEVPDDATFDSAYFAVKPADELSTPPPTQRVKPRKEDED